MKKILIVITLIALTPFYVGPSAYGATKKKAMEFAGQWPFPATKAIALDARGYAYAGNGDHILVINTNDNSMVTDYPVTSTGQVTCVNYDASRELLFVSCKADGLQIVNVQDPAHPYKAGAYYPDTGTAYKDVNSVAVSGDKAYIVGRIGYYNNQNQIKIHDVQILDISDITKPSLSQSISLYGAFGITYAIDIALSGGYAYVADLYNGVHCIKLSDPQNPGTAIANNLVILAGAHDLNLRDGYLYVASEPSGVSIIDISNPDSPKPIALYNDIPQVQAVRVNGNKAYLGGSKGLDVIDVSDKSSPKAFSPPVHYDPDENEKGAWSLALNSDATIGYMADFAKGLQILNLTDLSDINPIASFDMPADADFIDLANGYVYVVDDTVGNDPEDEGLRIFQLGLENGVVQLQRVAFCPTPGTAMGVYVSQSTVYIADGSKGLQIINANADDPSNPAIVGDYAIEGGFAAYVTARNNYAYVADHVKGLLIIDATDTSAPQLVSDLPIPDGTANAVAVSGNYAYVAAGSAGLKIIDISDPKTPDIKATIDSGGDAMGVTIYNGVAYIADQTKGLVICDISTPSNPIVKGSIATGGEAKSVLVASADTAYVSAGSNGIVAVNISDPTKPYLDSAWSYDTAGDCVEAKGFSDSGEFYLLTADSGDGIIALNPTYLTVPDNTTPGTGSGGCFISALPR